MGLSLEIHYKLSDSFKLVVLGGYDTLGGAFTSVTTGQSASIFSTYFYGMGGASIAMGQLLPVDSWLELTAGMIPNPTIGSFGIPSRNDQFSASQLSTWVAEAKYVITLDLNEYLDLDLSLGYRFIPAITAMVPSLGGGGSSEAVSINLSSIRAAAGVVFYF